MTSKNNYDNNAHGFKYRIVKLLSCFILNREKRHKFIDKHTKTFRDEIIEYGRRSVNNILGLLAHETDIDKVQLLKNNLETVEVETFSFCNRRCWFCPNSFIDRHSKNDYMDEKLYLKILSDLREIDYRGILTYSRYNEPFADRIILKRLQQAKEYLPNAILYTHSNGDYLNKEYLDEIGDAGLMVLKWQHYLREDEEFIIDNIIEKMKANIKRLNLEYCDIKTCPTCVSMKIKHDKIDIEYVATDFREFGCTRGDTLTTIKAYDRKSPCYIPFGALYIDYNGLVMPCCNLRSDIKEHENYIMGDTNKESLSEIFTSKKIVNLRKALIGNDKKPAPCDTCKFGTWKTIKDVEI